jgi:hypothetical protein
VKAIVRGALIIGAATDFFVAVLCLFFPDSIGPLLDFPVKDPALARVTGGELLVACAVYVFVFQNPRRFQPLFFICALDQLFAALIPAIEIAMGHVPGTIKTIGPIPLNVILCGIFIWAATEVVHRPPRRRSLRRVSAMNRQH